MKTEFDESEAIYENEAETSSELDTEIENKFEEEQIEFFDWIGEPFVW